MMQSVRSRVDSRGVSAFGDIIISIVIIGLFVACYLVPLGMMLISYRAFAAMRDAWHSLKIVAKSLT